MNLAPIARIGRPVSTGRPIAAYKKEHAPDLQQDVAIQIQRAQYDFMTEERAELAREFNDTRAFIVEQTKLDDETLKKYIDMI